MGPQINDLVAMGDVQTLYELMTEDEDWMTQLDAAEGLVKLGDRRGLDFLLDAKNSEDLDARQVAREILESPEIAAKRDQLEADERRALQARKEAAVKRLQSGGRVFEYKMVYLAAGELMDEDPSGEGFDVPVLTEYGLDGWEVVSLIPRHKRILVDTVGDDMAGAYVLLKKKLTAADGQELEQ